MSMPNVNMLLEKMELATPLIGVYDAPDPSSFEPVVTPTAGKRQCLFAFYEDWLAGRALRLTKENFGCPGAGSWLCGVQAMPREGYIRFLVDGEGLKASHELMNQWLQESHSAYEPEHGCVFIGPLREDHYELLKTITFLVTPDQMSVLVLAANYFHAPDAPPPVQVPFASGCGQLLPMFEDLAAPQAIIGSTDLAMRQHLPPEIIAFTVTKPMFEQFSRLDHNSFLEKPFLRKLKQTRPLAAT